MAATVELLDPRLIQKNPDNPRLIFHQNELDSLAESIREQGILVPLTVYSGGKGKYTLLDGERRWRCAVRLGLNKVPAIVQQKPDKITNIMMMFAIHNARKEWDPLPAALKLEELEQKLTDNKGKTPTIRRLAAAASLSTGEVRRYKKILGLPSPLRQELMEELHKVRAEQKITVDHAIEAMDGVDQLSKRGIIDKSRIEPLAMKVVAKFRENVLHSTTEPRKFVRIARAVERGEVRKEAVRAELKKFVERKNYTIENIYKNLVEDAEYAHHTKQLVERLQPRLVELYEKQYDLDEDLVEALGKLRDSLNLLLKVASSSRH